MSTSIRTTIATITDEQIRGLRSNAGEAGDAAMVALCDALNEAAGAAVTLRGSGGNEVSAHGSRFGCGAS